LKPAPFTYFAPQSVSEALVLLREHGEGAKLLAGGQSLVPLMNFRLIRPRVLIDINGLRELASLAVTDDGVTAGALVRQRELERSSEVARRLPILSEAIRFVGHPVIRNRGTVGGSLVHADPAAELPIVAMALDAEFQLQSAKGSRTLAAREFFTGYLSTAIASDELLVKIHLPLCPAHSGWCFTEIARRQGDFALVAVALLLGFNGDRSVSFARIALGGIGGVPLRAGTAEESLLGKRPSETLFREAAQAAAQGLEPENDIHASAAYRRHVAEVLVRRALETARSRAGGAETDA
jgi:carbon-monoxide dehydrogenase medium subunit